MKKTLFIYPNARFVLAFFAVLFFHVPVSQAYVEQVLGGGGSTAQTQYTITRQQEYPDLKPTFEAYIWEFAAFDNAQYSWPHNFQSGSFHFFNPPFIKTITNVITVKANCPDNTVIALPYSWGYQFGGPMHNETCTFIYKRNEPYVGTQTFLSDSENPQQLALNFKVIDECVGPGLSVAVRVGNRVHQLEKTTPTSSGTEQQFNLSLSSQDQGIKGSAVQILIDGKPVRTTVSPAAFSGYEYTADLGTVQRGAGLGGCSLEESTGPTSSSHQECESCSNCIPGKIHPRLGSVDLNIGLGEAGPRGGAMALRLKSATLGQNTAKAAEFNYLGLASGEVELIDNSQGHRQFVPPKGLFDLVDVKDGSNNYLYTELYFYHDQGTKAGGFYPGSGWYKTIRFTYELDSGVDRLTVTETDANTAKDTVYEYAQSTEEWSIVTAEGSRKEKLTETTGSGTRTKTKEIRNASNTLLSKVSETFTTFAWGEELTERINDPDGQALTSTWTYETNSGANGYKHLKKWKDESEFWKRYEYDAQGRTTKIITQYLNAADTAAESASRVLATTYNGNDRTEVETLLGVEIARRYYLWSVVDDLQIERMEECVTAGASAGAASNLVQVTKYRTDGETITRFDGTLVKTTELALSGGSLRTTTEIGEANGAGTDVVAGKRRIVEQDVRGNVLSDVTRDIAGNLIIAEATATGSDDFGRPTEITFLDATTEEFTYGCCGLEQKVDRRGLITSYVYDAFGNVDSESQAGVTITSTYDALGRLRQRHRIGSDQSSLLIDGVDFNLAGQETARYSVLGTTSVAESRAGDGTLTRTETLPGTATRIIKIHPDGHLLEIGGTAEFPKKYEYGVDATDGEFTKEIFVGESGAQTEWKKIFVNLVGRAWKAIYPDNATETRYWNTKGQLIREVDADGVTRLYGYNNLGEREDIALDANGNNQIDFSGTDRIVRDHTSYLQASGDTLVRRTLSAWDPSGQVTTSETDASQTSLDLWQRSFGLENHIVVALSGSGDYTVTSTANTGRTITSSYEDGRLATRTTTGTNSEALGAETYTYDPHARLASKAATGFATATYTYNSAGLLASVSQGGESFAFQYDARGNRTKVTRNGTTETNFEYFPTGLQKNISGALAYPLSYTYDPQGRPKTLTTTGQAGSSVTTWNYDSQRGWLTSKADASGNGPDYTYTPAGRLATRAWQRGITATYSYDAAGTLAGINYSDSTPDVTYTRNRLGQITGITDGSGARALTVATDGQLSAESYTAGMFNGLASAIGYDNFKRRNSYALGSLSIAYAYDGASRLASITSSNDVATYGYQNNSSLINAITQTYSGTTALATSKSYDSLRRLTLIYAASGGNMVSLHNYTYNTLDQRTVAQLDDGTKWNYQYDSLGQVTSAARQWSDNTPIAGQQYAYAYDNIGNRTSTTVNGRSSAYTANTVNQYTQRVIPGALDILGSASAQATVTINNQASQRKNDYFYKALTIDNSSAAQFPEVNVVAVKNNYGGNGEDLIGNQTGYHYLAKTPETFTYDSDGNLLADGRWQYTWDGENRLIVIESLSGAPTASKKKLEFGYDDQGRRISKKVYTWNGSAYALNSEIRFLYDGWNLVAELNGSNAVQKNFVWGADLSGNYQSAGGIGGLLTIKQSSSSYYPAYDGSGNVMELIKASNQIVAARYHYGAFGEPIQTFENGIENPIRYSTKYHDKETNFAYYGYRFLDASLGRWLNRDPLGEQGGINLYGYVSNDPINAIDPLGLDAWHNVALDWFLERGSESRDYDSSHQITRDLMRDEGVRDARAAWEAAGRPDSFTHYHGFGVGDYFRELFTGDGAGSLLGSYQVNIKKCPNGGSNFDIYNTTGWESGTRSPFSGARRNPSIQDMVNGAPFTPRPKSILNDRLRSEAGPGGNFRQHYYWNEP